MPRFIIGVKVGRKIGRFVDIQKIKYENALSAYAYTVVNNIQEEISTPKWDVGLTSTRWAQGRNVVGPIRDIVDSGELRDSIYIAEDKARNIYTFKIGSTSPYIEAIRFGYMSKRSRFSPVTGPFKSRKIAGRDFVTSAFNRTEPLQQFLRGYGVGGAAFPLARAINLATAE